MLHKVFNVFAVVLFSLQLFTAGADFADNHVADGVINLVLAAFWGAFLLISFLEVLRRADLNKQVERHIMELGDAIFRHHRNVRMEHENAKAKKDNNGRNAGTGAKPTGSRAKAGRKSKVTDSKVRSGSKRTSKKA